MKGLAQIWDKKATLGSLCTELPFCFLHGNKLQTHPASSNHKYNFFVLKLRRTAQEIIVSIWGFTLTRENFREVLFFVVFLFIYYSNTSANLLKYSTQKFSLIPGDVSVELLEMNYNDGYIRH